MLCSIRQYSGEYLINQNSRELVSLITFHDMRMVAALVVVLLAWIMLMFAATTTSSSEITKRRPPPPPPPPPSPPPPPPPIELDLDVSSADDPKARYSVVITKLRDQLKDTSCFGKPMLRGLPSTQREYIYVKLKAPERGDAPHRNTVELAIRKNDMYVRGYSYTSGGKVRARFFKDVFTDNEYQNIFANGITKENIGYGGSYRELEGAAGVKEPEDRRTVPLGMEALGRFINDISKPRPSDFRRTEARLLLIAVQMVPEAVRFEYIAKQVNDNIPNDFKPDPKVISLENNWGAISKAIASADPKTKEFKNGLNLVNERGQPWEVKNVDAIVEAIGLLNYVPDCNEKSAKSQLDHNVPAVSAQ